MARLRGRVSGGGVQLFLTWRLPLNATLTAYEQLELLDDPPAAGGLTPLGIPGFAGFFLSLLEQNDGWAIAITPRFAGEPGDVLIVAARGGDRIHEEGPPVDAAIAVFKQATEFDTHRRQTMRAKASDA